MKEERPITVPVGELPAAYEQSGQPCVLAWIVDGIAALGAPPVSPGQLRVNVRGDICLVGRRNEDGLYAFRRLAGWPTERPATSVIMDEERFRYCWPVVLALPAMTDPETQIGNLLAGLRLTPVEPKAWCSCPDRPDGDEEHVEGCPVPPGWVPVCGEAPDASGAPARIGYAPPEDIPMLHAPGVPCGAKERLH